MLCVEGAYCPFIHAADDSPRARAWAIPRRRLAHYLLVTSLDGSERLVVEGREHHVARGATYLIQPGWLCDLASEKGNRPVWVHFDLAFDSKRRQHPFAQAYDSELGPRARFLQPPAQAVYGVELEVLVPRALSKLFQQRVPELVQAWKRGGAQHTFRATRLLAEVLAAWVEQAWRVADPARAPPEERVSRAESVAMQSLGASFGLPEFAAAAGLSPSRFSAVYRDLRGRSPGAFLREARLNAAAELLVREALPAAQVGKMVGYADPSVFGRVFKKRFGASPDRFRRDSRLR